MGKYGYFDNKRKEFVITRPDTPTPWINYLGCEEYCALMSNTAGGYSFHKDPRDRRISRFRYNNVPADRPGRYMYLRDLDSGRIGPRHGNRLRKQKAINTSADTASDIPLSNQNIKGLPRKQLISYLLRKIWNSGRLS